MCNAPMNVRQPEISTAVSVRELFVIQPHEMENRRVQVVYVYAIFDGVHAELIGCPVHHSAFYSATCHEQ